MPNKVRSAFNLDLSGEIGPFGVTTTEAVVNTELASSIPWDILPGSQIKAGIAGKMIVGGNPVKLRVRVGAGTSLDNTNQLLGGAIAFEVTLPASTTTDLGAIAADAIARPTGVQAFAKVQVTALTTSGSSTLDMQGAVASIVPADGFGQGLYLHGNTTDTISSDATEHLLYEWSVDLSQFENVQDLLVGLSGQLDAGSGGTFRVRIGGTVGAGFNSPSPDGSVALTWVNTGGSVPTVGARAMGGAVGSVPLLSLPSGVRPVKLTAQSYGGGTHFAVALQEAH